jgi:hypothetical protein
MNHGTLGIAFVVSAIFLIAVLLGYAPITPRLKQLLLVGMALRVGGAVVYLGLMNAYYGGGDYLLYYTQGLSYAETIWEDGAAAAFDPGRGGSKWWGTGFVIRITGLLLSALGPTLLGTFLVFSLISYIGIVSMGLAFHRAYPHVPPARYLAWIVFFPSLWFWPASLGKDAILLAGVGLAALGYVGRRGRPIWLLMSLGLLIVFAIRPPVAGVLVLAFGGGHWLATMREWSFSRVLQGLTFSAAAALVVWLAGGALGFESIGVAEVDQ